MEEESKDIIRRSVSISREMDDWLKEHTEVNSSQVFRQSVYELQSGEAIHVSMVSLALLVVIVACFSFLLWILLPQQLSALVALLVTSFVIVILFKTVILYNKYQEEMKQWKRKDIETLLNEKRQ